MKLAILTAYNKGFAQIGDLCARSMVKYQSLYPDINILMSTIPSDYDRKPSWYKVGLIKKVLPEFDYVLWVDADAMIVGRLDFRDIIEDATLNIAKDENGINCGVMAWQNCPEAFIALDRMEDGYKEFQFHHWFEQASLMTFIDEVQTHYQPKHIWNAYQEDASKEAMIRHWPGTEDEVRLKEMKQVLESL